MVRVNTDMLPKKPAVYVKKAESETPDELDIPAKSTLADSPTTVALAAQLRDYFQDGGAFNLLMQTMPIVKCCFNTGSYVASVSFLKTAADGSLTISGSFELRYSDFGTGLEGSFTELDMEQQQELEEIIWNEFPFLRS